MAAPTDYPHLPLILTRRGRAKLPSGGKQDRDTALNRTTRRGQHAANLGNQADANLQTWRERQEKRAAEGLPLQPGIPLLLKIDPGLDLDQLRTALGFEIVSEEEDGFLIVASHELDLGRLRDQIQAFAQGGFGSGVLASVHSLEDESTDARLKRILGDFYEQWPRLVDDQVYRVDVGIECIGTVEFPPKPEMPTRGDQSDREWSALQARHDKDRANWSERRDAAYQAWDDLKLEREVEIERLVVETYGGEILKILDDAAADVVQDSFSVRLELSGKGLRDLILNHPYVFEVEIPDEVTLDPETAHATQHVPGAQPLIRPPRNDAPVVAVIDSGIQENHLLIAPAIDRANSYCWLPGQATSVADGVRPGGHGTRVAGAVLYGESVEAGRAEFPCWVQNARVLDANCSLPQALFPPLLIQSVVYKLFGGPRQTRVFNHSINAYGPCRTRHMSAWAAQIDALSAEYDVLVIQSAGNLLRNSAPPRPGIVEHLVAGRVHPDYLREPSSRIANPAQALQALTVGSVAYEAFETPNLRSFASQHGPSSFSRTGLGIWGVIKPEVVELGGDHVRSPGMPPTVSTPPQAKQCFPLLVRSTLFPPGPLVDRDAVGTSFATPKVTHIIAHLQAAMPEATTLLYRALVVHSARWPDWAANELRAAMTAKAEVKRAQQRASNQRSVAKKKGLPVPQQTPIDTTERDESRVRLNELVRHLGYGLPSLERALRDSPFRTTLHTSRPSRITVGSCHIHRVTLPASLRRQGPDVEVLIEVTLSYAAVPRRTRRTPKRYLSTWLDWKSNRRGEPLAAFVARALKGEGTATGGSAQGIPWTIAAGLDDGLIENVSRSAGTVQKDWAYTTLGGLPDDFCIAVVAHKGWSRDPDASVPYELVVSFEALDQSVTIYDQIRDAVEAEVEENDIEIEV